MIDALITDIPILMVEGLLVAPTLSEDLQATAETEELLRSLAPWIIGCWAVLAVIYETIAVTWRGQTIGKWILGLRVARYTDGQRPGWSQAALRCLLPVAVGAVTFQLARMPAIGAFAVFASAYVNPLRRGWHDDAGGTIVVRSR
jgi:uncharacterized RDD family membrane protein YckC